MAVTDDITDPRLAKALAHPLRLEILRHLGDRTASPSEIAAEIGAPLTNVSYHVRKLRSLGLIKLVRKTPKRGVVEHYYAARPRRIVTDQAWGETPPVVKEAVASAVTESIAKLAVDAGSGGGFDRSDAHISRQMMRLDEPGWKQVAKVLEHALNDILKIDEATRERLKTSHEPPIEAASVMLLFEPVNKAPASEPSRPAARPHAAA
ncbi:MAG: hypothetical protein QOC95_797 [Thermoleophilaceae bacterium]|nr:hypothetical protein [Thermoleophilaceae bacterium]